VALQGGYARSGYFFDPLAPVYSYPAYARVTTVYVAAAPPPVIILAPKGLPEGLPADIVPRNRLPEPIEAPEPLEPPLQGDPRGRFRPVLPEDRARAERVLPPPLPEKKEEKKKEEPRPDKPPPREGQLPAPLPRAGDPLDEAAQLVELGRESFADLEYGRAAQRFRQATKLAPRDGVAWFLLAEALLAQGKYHEAQDAILAGLERDPAWPTARFRPLLLYGTHVAEYPEQMRTLEETLARHPDDPVLLFLSAYQLWFDGRREEAQPLFRRARLRSPAPKAIDLFLKALPAEPVI
jgi:tetratricopeptide (TPR) repeat protein